MCVNSTDCNNNQPGADTDVNRLKLGVAERVYRTSKREPLGKGYQRGHQLPQKVRCLLVWMLLLDSESLVIAGDPLSNRIATTVD